MEGERTGEREGGKEHEKKEMIARGKRGEEGKRRGIKERCLGEGRQVREGRGEERGGKVGRNTKWKD